MPCSVLGSNKFSLLIYRSVQALLECCSFAVVLRIIIAEGSDRLRPLTLPLFLYLSLSPSLSAVCQVECVGLAGFVLIPSSFCVAKITMESREREKKGTSRRFGPPAAYV